MRKFFSLPLIRFLFEHLAYGLSGGLSFGIALLYFDVSGIWRLVKESQDGNLFLVLLFAGLFITFGGAGMAVGIARLKSDDKPNDTLYY